MAKSTKRAAVKAGTAKNTEQFDGLSNAPFYEREEETEEAICREARDRAIYGVAYWDEQWDAWAEDMDHLDGNQWPASEKQKRLDEERPALTINTFDQFVSQVLGDILQNRPSIHVAPGDTQSAEVNIMDTDGTTNLNLAEVFEGLIRQTEYQCGAEAHYDTAAQHAIETGMGWLRVGTRYTTDVDFNQELVITAIRNRWSVVMDPDATEPDMSDANWCFVYHDISTEQFNKRWPDKARGSLDGSDETLTWWGDKATTRIAEYFERIPTIRRLVQLTDGRVMWLDETFQIVDELEAGGISVHRYRDIETHIVYRRLITANSILQPRQRWHGSTIPVIPVAGRRLDFRDKRIYRGLIHNAKDAKQAENFFLSAAVERIGLAPLAPWLVEAEMIEGYEQFWDNANKTNTAYLPYKRTASGNKPERQLPAAMPVAEVQMAAIFTDKVKATIGMYDASLGNRSNETSGKAILARQRESDTGSFVFSDNLMKAIRRVGMVCTEVMPKILDTERVVRLRNRDGSGLSVAINQTVIDEETGEKVVVADMNNCKLDVVVKAGPSYNTQRQEAVEALLEFVRVVPAAGAVILDKIAVNMDWPGADDIAKRLVKMIPPQFLSEKERKDFNIDQQQPTPEQQSEMMSHEATMKRAEADIAMAAAKKAQADLEAVQLTNGGDEQLTEKIKDLVAQGLAEVLAASSSPKPQAAPAPQASNRS